MSQKEIRLYQVPVNAVEQLTGLKWTELDNAAGVDESMSLRTVFEGTVVKIVGDLRI